MRRKSTKPWIILIAGPFIALTVVAILQMVVRFTLSSPGGGRGPVETIINIISLLIGMVSVLAIMGLPIWIVMLVVAISHNNTLKQIPTDDPTQIPLPPQGQSPTAQPRTPQDNSQLPPQ